jgi:hypothetical protein
VVSMILTLNLLLYSVCWNFDILSMITWWCKYFIFPFLFEVIVLVVVEHALLLIVEWRIWSVILYRIRKYLG